MEVAVVESAITTGTATVETVDVHHIINITAVVPSVKADSLLL